MFKYSVLITTAIALLIPMASAVAETGFNAPIAESMSFEGDTFEFGNWADDNPVDVEEWPEDSFSSQMKDDPYPFANQVDYPFAPMAGGLSKEPFFLDSRFNTGRIYLDRFGARSGSSDTTNKTGERALTLANGDIIAAALVPKLGATADPTGAQGFNIGLVRYDRNGVRKVWSNPTAGYTDANKRYLVYPNTDTTGGSSGNYISIDDFQEHHGYLYVLATRQRTATNTDVQLLKIKKDGNGVSWHNVFYSTKDETGAGMYFYEPSDTSSVPYKLVVVGSVYDTGNNGWGAIKTRYNIQAGTGSHGRDSTFTGSNLSVSGCTTDIFYTCEYNVRRIKGAPSTSLDGYHSIYIYADYIPRSSVGLRRLVVMKIDQDGYLDSSFGAGGMTHLDFYQEAESGASKSNSATGLALESRFLGPWVVQSVYLSAGVSQVCGRNIGVAKLKYDGTLDTSFGSAGKRIFGTHSSATGCPGVLSRVSTRGNDLVKTQRGLALAGSQGSFLYSNPILAIIDQTNGNVKDLGSYSPTGISMSYGTFSSVAAVDGDSVYVVGTATDANNNKKSMVMTARMRSDRIFGHGMED